MPKPSPLLTALLCLLAGAAVPLSLAPFNLWYIAPFCLAFLALSLFEADARSSFWRSFIFGLGLYGVGISWVYVSIHDYGYAPVPLALLLTFLFIAFNAFFFALPFYLYAKFSKQQASHPSLYLLLIFPALWVLGEWSRSWLFTGFPWLYLGYGHVNTPLSGWLPIGGVYLVSCMVAYCAAAIAHTYLNKKPYALIGILILFTSGFFLQKINWTALSPKPITVGIVQPNFSLHDKWNPEKKIWIRQTLAEMSEPLWQTNDVVLWPEAALSEFYQEAIPFLDEIKTKAKQHNSTLITGIPYFNEQLSHRNHPIYHNSIMALGNGQGLYHKVRLVPFGEYVPLEKWLRGIIQFFNLPMSQFTKGDEQQSSLYINDRDGNSLALAPFICYEIVYPFLVAKNAKNSAFLVTISNDSWFGDSIGPQQHLQMAQVRAIETGRYVVRGTNDGISAIIDPKGKLIEKSERFKTQTLQGEIFAAKGETPLMNLY